MNGNKFEIVVSKNKNLDFLLTILKKKKPTNKISSILERRLLPILITIIRYTFDKSARIKYIYRNSKV